MVNCFCSTKYLTNLCQEDTLVVIRSNGGFQTTNWQGDYNRLLEPVWWDNGGILNIISLKRAKKFFKIMYYSENNDGFVVIHHENEPILNFCESITGLHLLGNFRGTGNFLWFWRERAPQKVPADSNVLPGILSKYPCLKSWPDFPPPKTRFNGLNDRSRWATFNPKFLTWSTTIHSTVEFKEYSRGIHGNSLI